MLADIFSSLDSYSSASMGLVGGLFATMTWLVGVFGCGLVFGKWWVRVSPLSEVVSVFIEQVFPVVVGYSGKVFGGYILGHLSFFVFLLVVNFAGMVPGVFSVSSQLSFSLSLGVIMWFWAVWSGCVYGWSGVLGHLLPAGTPAVLSPLMIVIESVSIMIRPVTLSVRIAANITMGHVVLSLLGGCTVLGFSRLWWGFVGLYVVFEFLVCFLQAYVFMLLVSLYTSDHPN
uniref:ATP synthase subunit a n=1 Tax=Echyridella menziesii TaxID=981778 RepID=A0A1X9JQC3_9BIVA|nr:ATP synthase F0 subunit 6 [Echyridella menziesii]